jgi:hypothetical protein
MDTQNPTSPSLIPLVDDKKRYQVVKQTVIPAQFFIGEDDVVSTLAIPFVFVQAHDAPANGEQPAGS